MMDERFIEAMERIAEALERLAGTAERTEAPPVKCAPWDDPDRVPDFIKENL
jgi:hypothetical protein